MVLIDLFLSSVGFDCLHQLLNSLGFLFWLVFSVLVCLFVCSYLYILTLTWIEWYFLLFPFSPYLIAVLLVKTSETLVSILNESHQQLYLSPKLFKDLGRLDFRRPILTSHRKDCFAGYTPIGCQHSIFPQYHINAFFLGLGTAVVNQQVSNLLFLLSD